MDNIWNIILYKQNDDKQLVKPKNNPKESGKYLCTCVNIYADEEAARYLQIMEYDAVKDYWHDCGHPTGISHNILAWTDKIKPCDFTNYNYIIGGYFVEP